MLFWGTAVECSHRWMCSFIWLWSMLQKRSRKKLTEKLQHAPSTTVHLSKTSITWSLETVPAPSAQTVMPFLAQTSSASVSSRSLCRLPSRAPIIIPGHWSLMWNFPGAISHPGSMPRTLISNLNMGWLCWLENLLGTSALWVLALEIDTWFQTAVSLCALISRSNCRLCVIFSSADCTPLLGGKKAEYIRDSSWSQKVFHVESHRFYFIYVK